MIVTAEQYKQHLFELQSNHAPILALLPTAEKIYDIDLDTRKIISPEYLSVARDHQSETIYFKIDRYFDYMDLATTTCIVRYKNAAGQARIYTVPFYDTVTFAADDKMIFPWCIDGEATAVAGPVQYSICFYKIAGTELNELRYTYNLNTLPAESKVMYGLDVESIDTDGKYDIEESAFLSLTQEVENLKAALAQQHKHIYWLERYSNDPNDFVQQSIAADAGFLDGVLS